MNNDSRLDQIKERVVKATEGPWKPNAFLVWTNDVFVADTKAPLPEKECFSNSEFIANARMDVPYLLEQIEKRDRLIEALEDCYLALHAVESQLHLANRVTIGELFDSVKSAQKEIEDEV